MESTSGASYFAENKRVMKQSLRDLAVHVFHASFKTVVKQGITQVNY